MSVPTDEALRSLFDRAPAEPLTAAEVADRLDCSRRDARDGLDRLVDRGFLNAKSVGDGERVWWRPAREPDTESNTVSRTPDDDRLAESGTPGREPHRGSERAAEAEAERPESGDQRRLESELAATRELQAISTRLIREGDIEALYDEVVDAATGILDADFGCLQLFDPDRGELELLSHRGFGSDAAAFWERVDAESDCICGRALETGERVVASDIETCEFVGDGEGYETYLRTGIRAGQSTPLVSRSGDLLGMLSTYWDGPHEPSERDLRLLDVLARQAADLIERRRSREELRESEERLRAFVTASFDVVYRMSPDWSEMRYLEGRDFLSDTDDPRDSWVDAYIPPEEQGRVEAAVEEAIETGSTFELEHRVFQVDGSRGWTLSRAVPITDDDGEIVEWFGTARDITERKEREERLEELIDRLETSNERLEQFAYAASHDLQEPLRMVSSYLQLIERRYAEELDDDGREFLDHAVNGADRMREMIDGLLAYSRVETRADELAPVDLDAVLEDVRESLRVRIEESDAEITADPLPRVEGDAGQLRQVFQNLLDNAIEYSGDEPPRVHVSADREGSAWVVRVRDEGIGIPPEQQATVFEVFERLHSREEHEGTGIGLALCERIVERHGGEITVDSEPDEGSTFSVTLPAVGGDEDDDEDGD